MARADAEPAAASGDIGLSGERLTRNEAFDLLRRSVASLTTGDESVKASAVRERARELLGRDSESLSERNFIRILKDAHDGDALDLRRRGDDFEVGRAAAAPSVGDQLAASEPPAAKAPAGPPARLSLRGRGSGRPGRLSALPPELLSIGVVAPAAAADNGAEASEDVSAAPPKGRAKRGARKVKDDAAEAAPKAAKRPRKARAKKAAKEE